MIETIKSQDITKEDKILYTIGVLSNLFLPLLQSDIFNNEKGFFEFLRNGMKDYSGQNFIDSFSLRVRQLLDENNAKSLIIGCAIAATLSEKEKGLILDRKIIAEKVYSIDPEEKLNLSHDEYKLRIYIEFAQEIMNS